MSPDATTDPQKLANHFVPFARFSVVQVYEIRRRLANGDTLAAIARDYDAHPTTIAKIRDRRSWNWLPEEPIRPAAPAAIVPVE